MLKTPLFPHSPSTQASHSYRWYVLAILLLAQTCHGIDRAIIGLVLEPVGQEFGLSDQQRGLLAGFAYGIFFAIAAVPFGVAADKYNRRALMTMALTVWSGATALCSLATGFWTLLLGRATVGAAESGGSPTGMSLISDYFEKQERSTAIGIWFIGTTFGLSLAFFVGGWIVEHYGWRMAFFAAGVPGLLLAPLLFFSVREPKRGQSDARGEADAAIKPGLSAGIGELIARPGLVHCILAIVMIAIGIYGMSSWLTSFLIRSHNLPISQAGVVVAIAYGVFGSAGGFAAGWSADWLNRRLGGFVPARTVLFAAIIPVSTAITGAAAVAVSDLSLCIALLFVCGFFSASYNGPIYAVIMTLAGSRLRGLAASIAQFGVNLIGVGLGPYFIGAVSQFVGNSDGVAWGIAAAMLFVLSGGVLLMMASSAMQQEVAAQSA